MGTFATETATLPASYRAGRGDQLVRHEYDPFDRDWMGNDVARASRFVAAVGYPGMRENAWAPMNSRRIVTQSSAPRQLGESRLPVPP
jgi:hypothetical protein